MNVDREYCGKCKRPKDSIGSGSITSWISSCRCQLEVSGRDSEAKELDICSICGKRVSGGRAGSFTQFVFRSDLCSCDRVRLAGSDPFSKISQARYHAYREVEEDIEPDQALVIDDFSFPKERYKPLRKIGMGAAGNVYVCFDEHLRKLVAVKVLRAQSGEHLVSFQNEAKVLSRLEHPNIARILDFGAEGGAPYMVLEYGAGISLRRDLDDHGRLSVNDAIEIFLLLADALIYCHQHGVLHRDLKPENILYRIREDGTRVVKLIDFGIALLVDQEKTTTIDGKVIAGTPAYMSPDQVKGQKYDERSEIYSLGCVFFEALTGRPPFVADLALSVLSHHANSQPPGLDSLVDEDFPQEVQDFVSICLAKNPDERFPSMKETRAALLYCREAGLKKVSGVESQDLQSYRPGRKADSKFYAMLVLVLLMTVSIFAYGSIENSRDKPNVKVYKEPVTFGASLVNVKVFSPPVFILKNYARSDGLTYKSASAVGAVSDENLSDLFENCPDLGELRLGNFEDVSSRQYLITHAGWKVVSKFPLHSLVAPYSSLADEDLKYISKMQKLQHLELNGANITNAGLKFLENSPSLSIIRIANTLVTDDGIKSLSTIKNLRQVMLRGESITDRSLFHLRNCPNIQWLSLSDCRITDEAMRYIAGFERLSTLSLQSTRVGPEGFRKLRRNPYMTCLDVDADRNFNDECLSIVSGRFPHIDTLNLSFTGISPAGLKYLPRFKYLRDVNLGSLNLKDEDLKPIQKCTELSQINLMSNKITDQSLRGLALMPKLRYIALHNCQSITAEGLKDLKRRGKNVDAIHTIQREDAETVMQTFF